MADSIEQVQVEVTASAKGISQVFSQLESQLKSVKSLISGIDVSNLTAISKASKSMKVDTSGMSKAEKDISSSVNKIKQSIAGLNSYKNAALSGDSSSLTSFNRRVISIQSSIDVLGEKLRQLENNKTSINIDTDKFQTYRTQLAEIQATLSSTKFEVDTGTTSSALSEISDKAKDATSNLLSMTASGIKSGFSNLKSSLSSIKDTLSSIGKKASITANTGFSKILKYGFGIRSLYVLFRRLRTAIKDSFTELQNSGAYYETTRANIEALKSSLTTLKYQFGAAFEPIFNTIAPALQTLINYLVAVMNTISAFIAKLTGKSTYSKAVAATAEIASNTGSAAGSASELNKQLQGFDELNNLDLDSGSSGGSGGGSSGDSSDVTYIEESVESALGNFTNTLIDQIKAGDWEGVGNTLSTKITEALNGIDWTTIKSKASKFGTNLASFFNGFITTDLSSALGTTLAEAFNTAFTSLNSFGTTFDWTNFGTSIGTGLSTFFKKADFSLWGDTVHTWLAGILDAGIALLKNTDFEEIGKKLADFLNGLQVGDIASKLYTFAQTLVSGIATAITSLWNNADMQNKIGLAIVGMLVVGKLTGLSTKLGASLTSYFISNPIVLGKIALAVTEFTLVFETASNGFGDWADYFGDSELGSYYKNFTWSEFWDTITNGGEGIDTTEIKNAWNDMCDDYFEPLFDAIDSWIDKIKEKVNSIDLVQTFKDATSKIKKAWSNATSGGSDNGNPHGYNGAPSDVSTMLDYQNSVNYWNEQGSNIIDGIVEGIEISLRTNPFTGPILKVYNLIKTAYENTFDSHSPARAMYEFGENILLGIIEGFIQKMNSYSWDDLMDGLYNAFTGTTTTKSGGTAQGNFNRSTNKTHSGSTRKTTLNVETQINGTKSSTDSISNLKTLFTNLCTEASKGAEGTYSAKVGGEIDDINDLTDWKSKFSELYNKWQSKNAILSASEDGISNKKISGWITQFDNLKSFWKGKDAKLTTSEDGLANGGVQGWINTLAEKLKSWVGKDAKLSTSEDGLANGKVAGWIDTLGKKATEWAGKSTKAVLSTVESGLSNFDGKQGYKARLDNLVDAWSKANRTATFTTNLSGNLDTSDKLNTAATAVSTLSNSFTGNKSASYSVTYSGPSGEELASTAGGVSAINSSFSNSSSQSLEYTLTAGVDMDSVNKATAKITNEIKKGFTGTFKVSTVNADGGIINSKGMKTKIPQYAGGTLNAGSLFVAGEAGPEIMGHINGRTEILNRSQIASIMNNSYIQAMNQFRNALLNTPTTPSYQMSSYQATNDRNTEYAMNEQNALLREQNDLLRQLVAKDTTISSKDVFNAVRGETSNYYNRTGNNPFIL